MKTQNLVLRFIFTFTIGLASIALFMMIFSSCKKNEAPVTPGNLQLKANTSKQMLKSGTLVSVGGGTIALDAAKVEIKQIRIEENSGIDAQSQSGGQSGSKDDTYDAAEKSPGTKSGGAGDIMLTGPYLLNILNGAASIDQVMVLAGTYKKVDFEFFAGFENRGHSILLSGTFTNSKGVIIPFTITSDFAGTVELPIAGNGIQVRSGGTSTISVLFSVDNWLNKVDFNSAILSTGKININKAENPGLYRAFITELSKNIDIEN